MQKWEKKDWFVSKFGKIDGLEPDDIDWLYKVADAMGMDTSDELIPFLALTLQIRRDSINRSTDQEAINAHSRASADEFKSILISTSQNLNGDVEKFKTLVREVFDLMKKDGQTRIDELNEWGERQREVATMELATVSKEVVGKAIEGASDELQQQVEKIANGVSQAVIDSQAEAKASEFRKIDALHKRSQTIILGFSALILAIAISVTAVLTHVYTRESTLVVANELVQYAKSPNAAGYLEWLRMYDENRAVILRTCGAAGDELVQNSGLCTPTIRISKNVPRLFDGVPVAYTIEAWWLTRSSWSSGFIGAFATLLILIGAPHLWNSRWPVWLRQQLRWLWKW